MRSCQAPRQDFINDLNLRFGFLPWCFPQRKVAKFTSIPYCQRLDACCGKPHPVIRFMKQGVFDILHSQFFDCCKQVKFRFDTNQYQMDHVVWFFEFKACLQTGMPHLNNLICKRYVNTNQNIYIQRGKLLISHWNSPGFQDRHQMGMQHL
jgi:hypothetical protein